MGSLYLGQAEQDHSDTPIIWGDPDYLEGATIAQDGARAIPLADVTLMAQVASTGYWTPLNDLDPAVTPGKMVCGALGATIAEMQAISDGSFIIGIDGETVFEVSGLDFSEIESVSDTSATAVCAALGTNLAGFQAVTDGGFKITIDGTVIDILGLDWSAITALDEVADTINYQALGRFISWYDSKTTFIWFRSLKTGALSTISVLTAPSAGTDVSGSGFLNGATATLVQGVGSDGSGVTMADVINSAAAGRFSVEYDGVQFTFLSPTEGAWSAVSYLTAGVTGTDISGASFLNGLTGTGTITAGTGLDGSHLPAGIFRGSAITAADMVAGTTLGEIVLLGNAYVDEDLLILENSLDLDTSVIPSVGMNLRTYLHSVGLKPQTTKAADAQI